MAEKVYEDEYGEYVYMPSGGGPNDHVFTKVYLDELGYDPRDPVCVHCEWPLQIGPFGWEHTNGFITCIAGGMNTLAESKEN